MHIFSNVTAALVKSRSLSHALAVCKPFTHLCDRCSSTFLAVVLAVAVRVASGSGCKSSKWQFSIPGHSQWM